MLGPIGWAICKWLRPREHAKRIVAGKIVDKSVDRLLKGKTYNFIKCKNVDYSSTKTEEFLDLQLDVMGCKGVQDSLDKICKVRQPF